MKKYKCNVCGRVMLVGKKLHARYVCSCCRAQYLIPNGLEEL